MIDDDLEELEEISDYNSIVDLETENTLFSDSDFSSSDENYIITLPHLKLMTNLEYSQIPAVILDPKLNILWQNSSYKDLFLQEKRDLPINLVFDFSPYLTPEKLGIIYKNITDEKTGFSYKGRVESKHRKRSRIIANLILTPYFTQKIPNINIDIPPIYVGLFDNLTKENRDFFEGTFSTLLEASKLKDNDTGNHIKRIGEYSRVLAEQLFDKPAYYEVNTDFIENIFIFAPMHDVGKIGTPDYILTKPGYLTKEEWIIMKEHPKSGALILSAYQDPMAAHIANFHHEKWNGNGYPYGFSGLLIPLAARIVAIADVYDALRMKRSYKEPFTHKKAMEIITKDSGSHFDPDLIEIFVKINSEFDTIYKKLKDS